MIIIRFKAVDVSNFENKIKFMIKVCIKSTKSKVKGNNKQEIGKVSVSNGLMKLLKVVQTKIPNEKLKPISVNVI